MILYSDLPKSLYKEGQNHISLAEKIINEFLFETLFTSGIKFLKPKFKFLSRQEFMNISELKNSEEIWTHKRHFIFGSNLDLVFSSQFGVEILTETDPSKIRQKSVFQIEEDRNDSHLFHFKHLMPYLRKKNQFI